MLLLLEYHRHNRSHCAPQIKNNNCQIMTVEKDVGLGAAKLASAPADQSLPPRPAKAEGRAEGKAEAYHQPYQEPQEPFLNALRPSSDDDNVSAYSADNENERQRGRLLAAPRLRYPSVSPSPPRSWRDACRASWKANKGLVLVLVSQLFGALMNVTTRLLETSEAPMNTFQVCQLLVQLRGLLVRGEN